MQASRAEMRMEHVKGAASASKYFKEEWLKVRRPRVTAGSGLSKWVRAPFTVEESLPLASDHD